MSKSIDNKVVSMEFDNSKFEKPAKESISTLDKLKEALHFKNVESGFDAMNQAIRKVTFDPLAKGIDTVYAKFTFFERFTIQLYDRLATKILNTGEMIAKQTFTAPISTGKSEYEEKMGAVQTIMASSKSSMEDVNKVLAELNKYADDTIYSFSDMTKSIGKFTNAGVPLEDAVAAIKGISNEAARSGANANEASRAMYNFAQALSTGSVKLIDWKSIENANMATVEFKEALIDAAVAEKTLTKVGEGTFKTMKGHTVTATNFNEALSDAWLTSDVLINTLKRYSDVKDPLGEAASKAATEVKTFSMLIDTLKEALQSGWAESWEHIFGNFEQAKDLWTDLSGVLGGLIDRMSTTRNMMLKVWSEMGGREAMLKSFSNMWKALTSILGAVRDGFRTIFPPKTGNDLVKLTQRFERFTKMLIPSTQSLDKLRRTFAGVFAAVGILTDAFKALYNVVMPLVRKAFGFITSELLGGTRAIGNWVVGLRQSIKEGRVFERVFGKIGSVLSWVGERLRSVFLTLKDIIIAFKDGGLKGGFTAIKDAFMNLFSSIWDFLKKHNPIEWVKELGVKIAEAIYDWPVGKAIVDFVKKVKDAIVNSPVWKFCVGVIQDFVDGVQYVINKFRGIDTSATNEFSEKVEEGFHPLVAIKNFFIAIWNGIKAVWEKIGPMIKSFGSAIATAFKNLYNDIRGVVNRSDMADAGVFGAGTGLGLMLLSIAKFVHELASTTKNASSTVKNLKKLTNGLLELFRAFRLKAYAAAIKDTAISIGILAASLFVLSALPAGPLAQATGAILMLFTALTRIMKEMSALNSVAGGIGQSGILMTFGIQLAFMAAAILALVAAMVVLALIPYEGVLKGLAVLVLLMRSITSEIKKISETTGSSKAAGILLAFALFIQMLILPLSLLSIIAYFNISGLWAAVGVIVVMIAVMTATAVALSAASSKWGKTTIKVGGLFIAMVIMIAGIVKSIAVLAGLIAALDLAGKSKAVLIAFLMVERIVKSIAKFVIIMTLISSVSKKFEGSFRAISAKNGTIRGIEAIGSSSKTTGSGFGLGIAGPILAALLGMSVALLAITAAVAVLTAAAKVFGVTDVRNILTYMAAIVLMIGGIAILITAAAKASTKVNAEASATFKNNKLTISLFPKIVSYVLAAAVMVVAVAAAAKIINGVDAGDVWGAVGVMVAVFALIAGIGALSAIPNGFGEKFSKGIGMAGKAMTGFGKILLAFVVIIGIFLVAMALFLKNTDEDLNSFSKMIESHKDQIIDTVTNLIEIALTAALRSVFTALQTLSVETIKGLISVIDTLIEEGPELVARLLVLIGVVLDGIIDKAPEITEKLVQAIIAVLHGLGEAILKHSTEIVAAIDKVIESITAVWVKGLGKLFGIADKDLDAAAESVMGIAKPITLVGGGALTAMSSFNRFATSVKTFGQHISSIKGKLSSVVTTVKNWSWYISEATQEAGGLENAIRGGYFSFGKISGVLSKIGGFVASHPFALLAVGAGIAFKKLIDSSTNAIKVITYNDKKVMESTKSVREETERLNEAISNRGEAFKNIEKETAHTELLVGMLREAVDENNKVKAGYEQRVSLISQQLAGTLNVELDAQTRVLSVINEQNEAIDIQSEKVDEIIKKKQLQAKMEKAEEQVSDIREKIDNGWYEEQIAAAMQAQNDFKNALYTFEDAAGNIIATSWTNEQMAGFKKEYEEIKKEIESGIYVSPERLQIFNELDMYWKKGWITDAQVSLDLLDSAISDANDNFVTAKAAVKAVDNAWVAMDGTLEQAQKAIEAIDFNLALTDAGASTVRLISQFEQMSEKIARLISSGANISEETKQKYRSVLGTLASELGASEEGRKYLNDVGYNAAGDYIDGAVERLKEEASKNEELKKAGAGIIGNVWDGVVDGTLDNEKRLKNLYALVGDSWVADAFAKVLGIASPSKVFSKFGEYTILGLIQGVTKNEGTLEKTYSAMAASNVAAYTAAMSKEQSSIPFTPIFNSSGIQNGTGLIQRQLNNLTTNPIGATLTSRLAASVDTSQMDIDNSKIISSIADLKQGLLDLGETMSNLQVVMDTGATVGALAPGMDMELGRRTVRKQRGV